MPDREAISAFTENPYYRRLYEGAPEGAKRMLEFQFRFSSSIEENENLPEDEIARMSLEGDSIRESMTAEDCRYMKTCSGDPREADFWERLAAGK